MTNKKREAMLECMDAMEDAMAKIQNQPDIWQNKIIFWLCRSAWLLLEESVRNSNRSSISGGDASERRNDSPK